MYIWENFERWGSWFGSYSETYDEDGCNDNDDGWTKDCGLVMF
jgi:hypothetical protein